MTREEKARLVAQEFFERYETTAGTDFFVAGVQWADANPVMVTNTGWPYEKKLHDKIARLEDKIARLEAELRIVYTYIEVLEGNRK
jgi:hypothetical protein